jgi:hypothetical protein
VISKPPSLQQTQGSSECIQREEHRVARLQRLSGLPPDKTFRTLLLGRFSPLIREQLERLRGGAFLDEAINVVAAGKPEIAAYCVSSWLSVGKESHFLAR